jgi:hypothetical protein
MVFFERLWPPLMWSSFPAWQPREPSDLSGCEPGILPLEFRIFHECLLVTAHAVHLPSDLNGLNPDISPWLSIKFTLEFPWAFMMTESAYFLLCTHCIFCNIVSFILLLHPVDLYSGMRLCFCLYEDAWLGKQSLQMSRFRDLLSDWLA